MNIIALVGPPSCGKTTTLNILYQMLLVQGGVSTNRQQLGGNRNDFSDIVRWNGRSIVIFTMGDYSTQLIQAVQQFSGQNCDVFICACNSRLVKPQREFALYQNIIFNKNQEPNTLSRVTADNQMAQGIFNAI